MTRQRLQSLRSADTVPQHPRLVILFEGSRPQCLAREKELRPRRNIGWNKAAGGHAPHPWKHGLAPIGFMSLVLPKDAWRGKR